MSIFTIRSNGGTAVEVLSKIPADCPVRRVANAQEFYAHGNAGKFAFQQIPTPIGSWWYSYYEAKHDLQLVGRADIEVLELFSSFRNHFASDWEGIGTPSGKENQLGLAYTPYVENKATFRGGQVYETMDFHPDTKWLMQTFGGLSKKMDRFLQGVNTMKPTRIDEAFFLTPPLRSIIHGIAKPDCHPSRLDRFLELKTETFMDQAITVIDPIPDPTMVSGLTPILNEKAEQAAYHLRQRLTDPPTIAELARLVTSNAQTVQKIFKARYTVTIDEYSRKLRLELACQFLLDTSMDLHAIAFETGYHDASALSVAFKRMFGSTPGEFRKRGGLS